MSGPIPSLIRNLVTRAFSNSCTNDMTLSLLTNKGEKRCRDARRNWQTESLFHDSIDLKKIHVIQNLTVDVYLTQVHNSKILDINNSAINGTLLTQLSI